MKTKFAKIVTFLVVFLTLQLQSVYCEQRDLKWQNPNRPNYNRNSCQDQKCQCAPFNNPTSVICQRISDIPSDLSPFITLLSLKYSKMFSVSTGVLFQYSELQKLILAHNEILTLESENFVRLKKLQDLELNNNKISGINENAFGGLTELKNLDLSNNELSEIPQNLFDDCPNLQSLDLSHNKIANLPQNLFEKVTSLQVSKKFRHFNFTTFLYLNVSFFP